MTAAPAPTVSLFDFVGDGEFPGEGGVCLQLLWQAFAWSKMRVHCPGRYYIPGGVGSQLAPAEVIQLLHLPEDVAAAVESVEVEVPGKDPILLSFFPDGGGLLTYIRRNKAGQPSFIHTLNTTSGLQRKLVAMNLAEVWNRHAKRGQAEMAASPTSPGAAS